MEAHALIDQSIQQEKNNKYNVSHCTPVKPKDAKEGEETRRWFSSVILEKPRQRKNSSGCRNLSNHFLHLNLSFRFDSMKAEDRSIFDTHSNFVIQASHSSVAALVVWSTWCVLSIVQNRIIAIVVVVALTVLDGIQP